MQTRWSISAYENNSWLVNNAGEVYHFSYEIEQDKAKFHQNPYVGIVERILLPFKRPIRKAFAGREYVIFLDDEGVCFAHGRNEGQFGIGEQNSPFCHSSIMPIPFDEKIETVVTGYNTTFFKDIKGNWYACGDNNYGQLGLEKGNYILTPIKLVLDNGKAIDTIKTHYLRTFIKDITGQWHGCGQKDLLGMPDKHWSKKPAPCNFPWIIKNITLGFSSTFFQDDKGNWYACGWNDHGQLLIEKHKKITEPRLITLTDNSILDIISLDKQTLFLDNKRNWHSAGELSSSHGGIHDCDKSLVTPSGITANFNTTTSTAGSNHAFYKDTEENWYGYGSNGHGQLGLQNTLPLQLTPQLIDFKSLCHRAKPQEMPLSLKGLIKNYQEAAKNNQLENMKKIEIMFKKYLPYVVNESFHSLQEADNFLGFVLAATAGHIPILEHLGNMHAGKFCNMMQKAFAPAAGAGQLQVLQYFRHFTTEIAFNDLIADDYFESFKIAAQNGHIPVLEYFKKELSCSIMKPICEGYFNGYARAARAHRIEVLAWMEKMIPDSDKTLEASIARDNFFSIKRKYLPETFEKSTELQVVNR